MTGENGPVTVRGNDMLAGEGADGAKSVVSVRACEGEGRSLSRPAEGGESESPASEGLWRCDCGMAEVREVEDRGSRAGGWSGAHSGGWRRGKERSRPHRQRARAQVSMDVAANDVEAQLGNRKGRFWSDVGGVLGAVVAILWSDGRRRVEGSDSGCARAGRQWQVGFVGERGGAEQQQQQQQCNRQKHSGRQRRPDDIHTRAAVSRKSEGESKHRQVRYG
jgi:hypothetical protein